MATNWADFAVQKVKQVASSLGKTIQQASTNPILNPGGYLGQKAATSQYNLARPIIDTVKGFVGENFSAGGQNYAPQPFVPKNYNQQVGVDIQKFIRPIVEGQNMGVNQLFDQGARTLGAAVRLSPKTGPIIASAEQNIGKFKQLFSKPVVETKLSAPISIEDAKYKLNDLIGGNRNDEQTKNMIDMIVKAKYTDPKMIEVQKLAQYIRNKEKGMIVNPPILSETTGASSKKTLGGVSGANTQPKGVGGEEIPPTFDEFYKTIEGKSLKEADKIGAKWKSDIKTWIEKNPPNVPKEQMSLAKDAMFEKLTKPTDSMAMNSFINKYQPAVREAKLVSNVENAPRVRGGYISGGYNPTKKTIEVQKMPWKMDKNEIQNVVSHETRHSVTEDFQSWLVNDLKKTEYNEAATVLGRLSRKSGTGYGITDLKNNEAEMAQALVEQFTYNNKGFKRDFPAIYEELSKRFALRKQAAGIPDLAGFYQQVTQPKGVGGEGINPLMAEAKKYRSAEEFVKAQGTPVYHGTSGDFEVFGKVNTKETLAGKAGTFFTTNQTEASGFGKNIKETYLSPNAKIKVEYARDMPADIKAERIFKARKEGYDAVQLKNIQPLRGNRAELSKLNVEIEKLKPEIDKLNQRMLDGEITPEQNLSDPLMTKWSALLEKRNPTHTIVFNTNVVKTKSQLTDIYNQSKGVGGVPEGGMGGASSRKGSYKDQLDESVAQISKPELEKQLSGEVSTRTTAKQEVSSTPIIRQKGQLNIEKLNVEGAGKQQLKSIESKVKPTVIGNKEVIATARTAKGTGTMSDAQMKNLLAQQLKNRQKVVDLTVRFNQAKKNGATDVELGKIMLDMVNESKTARQGGTFAGRLLQAQNIVADQSASPTQKILALLDNAGVPPEKYLKDATKVNWDNPTEVVSFYRKYVPPKFGEVLDEIRYSNMLSSPLTHIINTASNALQTGIVAPIEKTITGALDWGKSALTGSERKYYARAGVDYAGGYIKSLPQAFKKAWNVMSGSETLVKPDFERIPLGSKGLLKAYSTPLRALEAMDQFFKTLVEGGVTSELKNAPKKLSMEEISSQASKEANYRLFRQAFDPNGDLGQGVVLKTFDKWNSAIANVRRLPGGKWVMPFLQTPVNILKQGVEYSPLGASTLIGAKAPIEQLSKTLIGTGVFLGAYQLAQNGLTSWESPSGETERELYYAAGMQPYSIKMGDKWVSFSKLGPLSYPIAMAAALSDAAKTNPDKSTTENIGKGVSGILGFFGDQSYVRSIGDLVDAIQGGVNVGPSAISAEAANLAGQLVPYKSFLTWLGRITDPTYRKSPGFWDKMAKDLPIVGSSLKPYTDMNGNPSVRDMPVLNAVSPYKVTQEKSQYKPMYDQYSAAKIQRGVEKRQDEKFMQGDTTQKGSVIRYMGDDGLLKKIDIGKVSSLPSSTEYEKAVKEKQAYTLADDILKLPVDQQAAAFAALDISPEDAVYYNTAKQEVRLKSLYVDEEISKLDTSNRANLVNYLISQRKEVNGSMVLTNGIVDELYQKNVVSESEKNMLKNLKIVNGKPITKLTGRGKKTALKKVSALPAPTKIKAPRIKTMKQLLAKSVKLKAKKYKFRRTL